MVTKKRRLTKKNMRSRRKSIKIRGSGAGPSALRRSAYDHYAMPPLPPPTQMTYNTNPMLNGQNKPFKTKIELHKAIIDYFKDITTRDNVIDTYGNISDWNTSRINDMSSIFNNIMPLVKDIKENKLIQLNWDTSDVTNMNGMFSYCYLNFKINFTNTRKVTDMSYMFNEAPNFNQPLPESFNTSKVTNMSYMFAFATNFNQPLVFDTQKVTNMHSMFEGAISFNQPIRFVTNITNFNSLNKMFVNTKDLLNPISIKINPNLLQPRINEYKIFDGSKIMEHPEYIKITKNEISVLGDDAHMLAYALTEADKRHASKTGTVPTYPAHTIDFDEFNEFLGK